MAGITLSQSAVRDPFAEARKKLEDKKGTVLSSSTDVAPPAAQSPTDIAPLLQKVGVDGSGIANNELGRIQLVSRLREKFGDNFYQNPDALGLLTAFDDNIKMAGNDGLNKMISVGDRTLAALMGGHSGL